METLNIQCIEQQQVLITLTLTDSNGAPVDLTKYAVYAASVGAVDPYCRRAARLEWAAAINNECSAFIVTAPGHDIARAPWKYQICVKNRQLGLEWAVVTGRVELTPRACGTDGIAPASYSVACEATPSGLVNVSLDATVGSISETLEQVKASAALASSSAANAHADLEDARKAATTAAQAATTAAADAKTAADAAARAEKAATDAPQACAPYVTQVQQAAAETLLVTNRAQAAADAINANIDSARTAATQAQTSAAAASATASAAAASATAAAQDADDASVSSNSAQLSATTATSAANRAETASQAAIDAQGVVNADLERVRELSGTAVASADRAETASGAATASAQSAAASAESAAASAASFVVNQTHDGTSTHAESGAVIQGLIDDEELRQLVSRAYGIYAVISATDQRTTDNIKTGLRKDGVYDILISYKNEKENAETAIRTNDVPTNDGWSRIAGKCRVLIAPNVTGQYLYYEAGDIMNKSKSCYVDFRSIVKITKSVAFNVKKLYCSYGSFDKLTIGNSAFAYYNGTSFDDNIKLPVLSDATDCFRACYYLIRLGSYITFAEVINGERMFYECSAMEELPVNSTFAKLENGNYMLYRCDALASLPETMTLGSLKTGVNMFNRCYKLPVQDLARVLYTLQDLTALETPSTATITLPLNCMYNGAKRTTSQIMGELYPDLLIALNAKGWTVNFA